MIRKLDITLNLKFINIIAQSIFFMSTLLKPFYFFDSGTVQPSDVLILLDFIILLVALRGKLIIIRGKYFVFFNLFLISAIIINSIYYVIYRHDSFILSNLYLIYNFIFLIVFSNLIKLDFNILKYTKKLLITSLLIQFLIYVFGYGKYIPGEIRYMGTFNDPNQMGFYVLTAFFIIVLINRKLNIKTNLLTYILVFYLITLTSSTGTLLGYSVFVFINLISHLIQKYKIKSIYIILLAASIILVTVYINFEYLSNIEMFSRVIEKIEKINNPIGSSTDYYNLSLFEERGLDRLLLYPINLIFGGGQGYYARFPIAIGSLEIHSTFPGILFYYGIIPSLFLMIWIWNGVKQSIKNLDIYFALIIESFILMNMRQSYFWLIFTLGYFLIDVERESE